MNQFHVKLIMIGQPQAIEFNMQCNNALKATGRVCEWAMDFFGENSRIHKLNVKQLNSTPLKDLLPKKSQEGDGQ